MIGKTIRMRGELSGDEDVFLDGQFEGKIELSRGLTMGKNADVQADVQASTVALSGKFQGAMLAAGKVEIASTATFIGNVTAPRIAIGDGAYFQGSIEMTGRADGER